MSSLAVSLMVLACVFGGALLGMVLRAVLPEHHLSSESKDIVKLGTGLVGTMVALVLGLLIASAKGFYDTQSAEVTQMSANIYVLDRALGMYGPETKDARAQLRAYGGGILDRTWPKEESGAAATAAPSGGEVLYEKLQELAPKNDFQRSLHGQVLGIAVDVGKTRSLIYAQRAGTVAMPLLVMLILWITFIFISFGLFAPFNATVIASLFAAAFSVSGAIFLILEMYAPYSGLIQIPSAPLRAVLDTIGR